MARADYRWTPRRIAGGAGIVLAGIAIVTVLAVRELRGLAAGPEDLRASLRSLQEQGSPLAGFNGDDLRIPMRAILRGGPPKDGIPALTEPDVVPVGRVSFLADSARVIGVTVGAMSRAYPVNVLMQHEAVNDVLDGVPIAVVYCPLCDSASVVDRRLDGRALEFGVSGRLVNSNVLLYDRTDQALWSQLGFMAISGPNAGRSLRHLPWEMSRFDAWRSARPEGTVVSYETGHGRNYERQPYAGYFDVNDLYFPVSHRDPRLPVKTRVVGVQVGAVTRAYPLEVIAAAADGVVRDRIDGEVVVLTAAADSGQVRVLEMPSQGRVAHTFWFAWAAFHPSTGIYRSKPE